MSKESFVHVLPDENPLVLSSAFYNAYPRSSFLVDSPSRRPSQEPCVKTEYSNQIPNSLELSAPFCHRASQADCWSSLLHTPTSSSTSLQLDTKYDEDEEEGEA